MSAVLQPLESLIGEPIIDGNRNRRIWDFSRKLTIASKDATVFNPIVEDLPILNLRYSVQCTRLAHNLNDCKEKNTAISEQEIEALTRQIIDALAMAELLTYVYRFYFYVPSEVRRLLKEQKVFRALLDSRRISIQKQPAKKLAVDIREGDTFTQVLKKIHRESNWPRLFAVRIRRVFFTLIPYLQNLKEYSTVFGFFDYFLAPALNHLSYLFFIPRLVTNVFLLLKHVIPGWWLTEQEKQLSWLTRLQAQVQRRWPEIANDAAWMVGGILNCYVLVGSLAPIGMYLSISLFFYDVLVAGLRAFLELGRLNKLLNEFEEATINPNASLEELREIADYRHHLRERISSERKQLLLSVVSTSALFLAMCFAIPLLAGNPLFPLIGAILVLSITLATYLASLWLDKQRPSSDINKVELNGKMVFSNSLHTMFRPRNLSNIPREPTDISMGSTVTNRRRPHTNVSAPEIVITDDDTQSDTLGNMQNGGYNVRY